MRKLKVTDAHTRHQQAVAAYLEAAEMIPAENWHAQRPGGKWSPAEITAHLELGFHAFCQELAGGPPMQMRLRGWKLVYVRWKYLRRILADGEFPSGARAPRETRPTIAADSKAVSLARFRTAALGCEELIVAAHGRRPPARLTHPYFGGLTLAQALFVSARHIEHHQRQLGA